MKKFINVLFVLFLLLVLIGCKPKAKTFSGSGVTITLDSSFVKKEVIQAPFYLESKNHIFMANRESKSSLKIYGIDTLEEYIKAVLVAHDKTAKINTYDEDGIYFKYAYYESVVEEQTFGYMLITMEGENHFYTMNFGCYKKDLEDNKDLYFKWAKTITVE